MKVMRNRLVAMFAGMLAGALLSIPIISLGQDYFQASGIPVQRSAISSAEFRTEFSNIQTNLSDKLPPYTGNSDNFVVINPGGTALTSITASAASTLLGAPQLSANETVTGQWTFEGRLDIDNGIALRLYDSTDTDFADFSHDGTDFNLAFTTTTDWNITGITALSAGAVDADFDAITGTSYGGITEANLLDKTAAETISGAWTHSARLVTDDSTTTRAGFNVPEGVAPTVPVDGDVWVTAAGGFFARLNGSSVDLTSTTGEINDLTAAVTWANVPNANITSGSVTQHEGAINHDNLLGFLTAEHVDWAALTAGTIHISNYIENATHTGEVTGSAALTIGSTAISNKTLVTGATGDTVLVVDLTDGNLKKVNVADFLGGGGDMLIATYDPTAVGADAFTMNNMVEGAATKIMTGTERTKLSGIETSATADQTSAEIEAIVNHDDLLGFVANEHLDWTADLGATNLNTNNSANGVLALASGEVTQLANIGATTISAADWTATAALAGTNTGDQTITLTGDVTGSGTGSFAATIASTAISGKTLVTAVTGDTILIVDLTDGLLKKINASDLLGGGGDMLIATYDPTAASADAFAMDNMVEGTTTKIMTGAERTKLSGIETSATADQTASEIEGIVNHDNLLGFVANEHLDWTADLGVTNLNANNSANGSLALTSGEVTQLANIGATTITSGDWTSVSNLSGTNTGDQTITLTGDVTGSGTGSFAATIANDAVTLAKMANMATASLLGRNTAATGDPEVLSATTARSLLNVENGSTADQTSIVGITGTKVQFDTAVTDGNIAYSGGAHHDGFSDFVTNEHLDWTADLGATNLNTANSANAVLALTAGEVTQLANIGATVISAADWTATAALAGTNTGDQTITLTGDVTGSGTGSFAATIAADVVTMDKIVDITTDTFLGRVTAATGTVEVLTNAQSKTALDLTGTNSGDQTITLTGDVTGSGTGSFAATIASDAVTVDKMQDIATDTFLGRVTAATGTVEVLTNAQAKTALDLTGTNSGDEPSASETVEGIVERANQAEVDAGTDTTRYVSPATLENRGFVAAVTKHKTADTSRTNSTASDDPHLNGWTLDAASYYKITGMLEVDNAVSSTPDIKMLWQTSQTFQLSRIGYQAVDDSASFAGDTATMTGNGVVQLSAGNVNTVDISGFVKTHATLSSTVDFQWAQNSTNSNATVVYEGSWMTLEKM